MDTIVNRNVPFFNPHLSQGLDNTIFVLKTQISFYKYVNVRDGCQGYSRDGGRHFSGHI